MLVNPGGTGFLQVKLKNNRVKKRKIDKELIASDEEMVEEFLVDENINNSDADEDDDIFERDMDNISLAVLPEEIDMVKSKLKSTKQKRWKKIVNMQVNIYEDYGFFFVCPELVK